MDMLALYIDDIISNLANNLFLIKFYCVLKKHKSLFLLQNIFVCNYIPIIYLNLNTLFTSLKNIIPYFSRNYLMGVYMSINSQIKYSIISHDINYNFICRIYIYTPFSYIRIHEIYIILRRI